MKFIFIFSSFTSYPSWYDFFFLFFEREPNPSKWLVISYIRGLLVSGKSCCTDHKVGKVDQTKREFWTGFLGIVASPDGGDNQAKPSGKEENCCQEWGTCAKDVPRDSGDKSDEPDQRPLGIVVGGEQKNTRSISFVQACV
jgi:hypothetical protein